MIVGLGDDNDGATVTKRADGTTLISFDEPLVITGNVAPRPPTAVGSSFLDKVLPRKTGSDGQVRIWGLPPAVAYTLALVILAGGGYLAFQKLRGGRGRRLSVANPRRRRRRGASRAPRGWKR
jgi:hypothetical protein